MQQVNEQRKGRENRKGSLTYIHKYILSVNDYLENTNKKLEVYYPTIKFKKLEFILTIHLVDEDMEQWELSVVLVGMFTDVSGVEFGVIGHY